MTACRRSVYAAFAITIVAACGGDKGDSKLCEELGAEVAAREIVQKEVTDALKPALAAALATPPVAGSSKCEADGLNWQKFKHLTPEVVERGQLGDAFYLGEFKPGPSCAKVNPENTKIKLANLRERIKTTHYRVFFVDISRVGAKLLPDNKFVPGNVKGRLLVWSEDDKKFVCTGEGYAESGKRLHTIKGGVKSDKDLDDHLTRNAVRAGLESLKKIE